MADAGTYTDEDIVRARAKNIGGDPNPTDAMIIEYILQAQALIDLTMGFSIMQSFSAAKSAHLVVRQVTTDIAAFYAIAHDPSGFDTTSDAALVADLIYTNMLRGLKLLQDESIRNTIKNA